MAGPAPGTIMGEDYFGNASEWGEEADGGQVRGP
jgi:negative elongation factor C/D